LDRGQQLEGSEAQRSDNFWSFTDCTSYIVMREAALTEAFAYDDHFWQMGFIPVARRR